ncbi:MAG: InlB B-repeat-containing protein, partial [Clostridia bacterium]|nr:InlB B-repeat-containing protein [Clostridia bacterium]
MSGAQSFDSVENMPIKSMTDTTLNETYGELFPGSTYRYTDYRKVENMHSGAITDDNTVVTVDSTEPHGSQKNPFVIDSVSKWNDFAADINDTSDGITNYGADNYFVLTKDLDFSSSTFTPLTRFDGTFYGLGHTLKNITHSFGNILHHSGIFKMLLNKANITDLNVDNATFTDVGYNVGGIAGYTDGASILNCHATGTFSRTTRLNIQVNSGAILGSVYGDNDTLVYRCSGSYTGTFFANTTNGGLNGSIVGGTGGPANLTLLDCYGKGIMSLNNPSADAYVGGVLGAVADKSGAVRIENGVSYIYQQNVQNTTASHVASVLGFWAGASAPSNLTIKNVYASGRGSKNGTEFYINPTMYVNDHSTRVNSMPLTVENVNWYAAATPSQDSWYGELLTARAPSQTHRYSGSEADFWSAAQNSSALPSAIWVNKSSIDLTNYTIDSSPVINKLVKEQFDVEFLNYKNNSDESTNVKSITYDYGVAGTKLSAPTAPDANHKFVGWTIDKSGAGDVFTTLPDNIYGNLKLYAVWDNPNTTASISLYNSKTENNTDTLEYGTGNIKLTATSSGPGMTNPLKTFKWYKDSESTAVESGDTCTLTDVKHSGTYSLEYTLQDTIEPLWRHKEKLTTTQEVTINKGQLSIKSFELDSTTPAYVGIALGKVKFTVVVKDNGDNVVEFKTAVWQAPNSKVADGTNDAFNIVVTPEDTDNYSTATLTVSFESEYLKLTFDLDSGIAGEKIEVDLEYGEPYSANKIINMFLTEFRKIIDDNTNPLQSIYKDVENMAPYFNNVEISQYDTDLVDVTTPQKIDVMFIDKNYTITFKLGNGSANITQMRKFNQRLLPVANPTKDEHVFRGWQYEDVDDNGNAVTNYWDIDEDRVKGDLTLTADWFKAKLTLVDIEVTPKAGGYDALTVVQDSDLEVIAHYTTDSLDYPTYDQKIKLDDASGYRIIYSSSDGKLHVNNPGITVTYSYDGVTRTKPLTLTVNPKSLDEEMKANGVTFENKTVVFDGTAKEIGQVKGELPIQISEVQYEYWFGGSVVDKSQVVNIGLYTVRAKFLSADPDYKASDMEATLTISRTGSGSDDETLPSGDPNGGNTNGGGTLDDILNKINDLPLWQLIASLISIILIIIFVSKTISNESKRKNAKKTIDKKYSNYYAAAFLGLSIPNWTILACVLMGLAVIALALLIISSKRRKSAEEQLDDAREQAEQKKEEDMKMMFMRMMGSNANGGVGDNGYAYAQQGLGADEIRGIVSDTMTAMLPNFQQYLPQQASYNDEIINRLVENQEILMKKMAEQPVEKVVEKEVVASTISDETLEKLANKLHLATNDETMLKIVAQSGQNDEAIQKLIERSEKNDERIEKLMEKILELS